MPETNPVTQPLKGKKMLWVEDDSFLNYIISQKLTQEGIILTTALDGVSALKIAEQEKPDIIVLDVMLQGMDGVEILLRLTQNPVTKNIPVFVFSNVYDTEKIKEITRLGARGFFLKSSITLELFLENISKIMSNQASV